MAATQGELRVAGKENSGVYMDVSKNRGKTPKMDGENNGKPYCLMDDLGVPLFLETPILELPPTQDAIVTTRTMNHF